MWKIQNITHMIPSHGWASRCKVSNKTARPSLEVSPRVQGQEYLQETIIQGSCRGSRPKVKWVAEVGGREEPALVLPFHYSHPLSLCAAFKQAYCFGHLLFLVFPYLFHAQSTISPRVHITAPDSSACFQELLLPRVKNSELQGSPSSRQPTMGGVSSKVDCTSLVPKMGPSRCS